LLDSSHLERFIEIHAIEAEVIPLSVHTPTVEAAARAMGTTPERIVKSLLFLVKGRLVMAIASGPSRVERRAIAAYYGVPRKRVELAGADTVLATTGYPVGAVPPFGHLRPLPTLLDRRVLDQPEVYAGGGSIDALLRVSPAEIVRVTGAVALDLRQTGLPKSDSIPPR
jgi:prolyl-tRNA editing enzyme YbaK/EbsC (Cys-tRNA(Pro) deacylase)